MIDWLTGTMLATAALMALVLLIRRPVARHFGARIAYALWLIPAARLFMPSLTRTVEVPLREAAPSALSPETLTAIAAAQAEPVFDWTAFALTVWLGGAAMLFLWRMWSYFQQREDILAEAKLVDTIDGIRVLEAPAVAGPIAFGLIDKVVALPSSFFRNYSERERELALAHEISHHKSGDLFVNLAAFGLLCFHWFNPLAWIAWKAFRFDQEAACDARVLGASQADDRPVYGRAIAKAASGRPLIFASALDNKKLLKQRLRTMNFNDKSPLRRNAGLGLVIAGIAVALPLTASVSYAYVQAPEAPNAPDAPDAPVAPDAPEAPDAVAFRVPVVVRDENGDIERVIVRRHGDGEDRMHIDREALRRSLDDIPSREDLERALDGVPSRDEMARLMDDLPDREELLRNMPSREEMLRDMPSREELLRDMPSREAMREIMRDMPDREQLRLMLRDMPSRAHLQEIFREVEAQCARAAESGQRLSTRDGRTIVCNISD